MATFQGALRRWMFVSIAVACCVVLSAAVIGGEPGGQVRPAVEKPRLPEASAQKADDAPTTIARAVTPKGPLAASYAAWPTNADKTESRVPAEVDNQAVPLSTAPVATVADESPSTESVLVAGCPVTALPNDGSTSGNERAPNSNFLNGRSVWLITAAEAAANGLVNGTVPSAIGFRYSGAPGVVATGTLKVYLQNTADTTNTKSTTWTTAISGMTLVHNGTATSLPATATAFDIPFSGSGISSFTYTGGAVYVAFDWTWSGPVTASAVVACNTALVNGLKGANGSGTPPTTIAASNFRPETRLTPSIATVVNDASVDFVISYGAVPRDLVGPQVAQAIVSNRGVNALTNLPVTLTVTGAGSFTNTQTVASLAACGGQATVTFAGFAATPLGSDTLTVTVPPDDVASNNSKSVPMSVTVPSYSFKHAGTTAAGGVGLTGATGAFVGKFTTTAATSVTAVNLEFGTQGTAASTYRVAIYADSGSGTPGAQIYLDAADRTAAAGPISIPIGPISVGPGNFYAGLQQTNTNNVGLSFDNENPVRSGKFYLATPLPVTAWGDFSPANNFKLNIGVTLDVCASPSACDDGNTCTSDACDAVQGCTHTTIQNCNDGNACTVDGCDLGTGQCVYTTVNCNDGNLCTLDSCDPASGCVHTPGPNGNACDDGNPCTLGDTCNNGNCVPGPGVPASVQFCNGAGIVVNDVAPPTTATPYPATIAVSGLENFLCSTTVELRGVTHTFPDDIDVLLGGPGTANAIVMSDVGGGTAASGVNLTLADSAAASIPDAGPLVSGTFKPTNVNPGTGTETWPAPAPAPLGGSALSAFTGSNPNGTWSLYVVDDEAGDSGSFGTGWCLNVSSVRRFPPAGTDNSPTTGIFLVDVKGMGPVETSVSGMTLLQWQSPQTDPSTGQRTVQTELRSMVLTGSSPTLGTLTVRAGADNGLPPSLGTVTPVSPGADFPANAFFDVFFEVEVAGITLRNSEPLKMQATITEIPPRNIGLRNASPVLVTQLGNPSQVSVVRTAQHWMCPPPFPPPGQPCPVPCDRAPYPVCSPGTCAANQQCARNTTTQTCECHPIFPPAGTDTSPTVGNLRVDVIGVGPVDPTVSGTTILQWQNAQVDPTTHRRSVQTEMLSLDLQGSHPSIGNIHVTAGTMQGMQPTLGTVTPIDPVADFPALATFNVFFNVDVQGVATLRNSDPLVMQAEITEIPPRSIGLRNTGPIQIRDIVNPQHVDTIQTAQHWMCPPPFPPPGVPCPVPCNRSPYPACGAGTCAGGLHCMALGPFFPQDEGVGSCVCVGVGFPPAGTDTSSTVGTFHVDLSGIGPVEPSVSGQTVLQWQNPQSDRTVQTEMLSLDLVGTDPQLGSLHIRGGTANGLPASTGTVVPQQSGSDFPALATFNVFFEAVVNGTTTLRNDQPLVMRAPITEIPPRSLGLQNASPVQLRNLANPAQVNTIQTAQHWMCPPPYPPPGVPCPVPCERNPFPVCRAGTCSPDQGICVPDRRRHSCRCVVPFPPHGVDLSPTAGVFRVNIAGIGQTDAQVSGEVVLRWQDPVTGPAGRTVQTEMLSLDLSGTIPGLGPIHVTGGTAFGLPATLGSVTPLDSGGDFPANAFFDVFFNVDVAGTTLRNDQPLRMQAEITEIPPRSISLRNAAPVPLRNLNNPSQNNSIQTAAHWMCPPPYLPPGQPCPIQCSQTPAGLCSFGVCAPGLVCQTQGAECGCVAPPPPTSGTVPDRLPQVPLRLGKVAGGQIKLDWGTSCLTSDTDYAVYDGVIPTYYSHASLLCSTGGATTATIATPPGRHYYIVVPHSSSVEGSYSKRSSGVERPQGTSACLPQALGTCP